MIVRATCDIYNIYIFFEDASFLFSNLCPKIKNKGKNSWLRARSRAKIAQSAIGARILWYAWVRERVFDTARARFLKTYILYMEMSLATESMTTLNFLFFLNLFLYLFWFIFILVLIFFYFYYFLFLLYIFLIFCLFFLYFLKLFYLFFSQTQICKVFINLRLKDVYL